MELNPYFCIETHQENTLETTPNFYTLMEIRHFHFQDRDVECTDYILLNRHAGFHLIQTPAHPTTVRGEKDPPKPGLLGSVSTGLSYQDHLLHWKHSVMSQLLEPRSGDVFGA